MNTTMKVLRNLGLGLPLAMTACQAPGSDPNAADDFDAVQIGGGDKADMVHGAHILSDIDLDSEIQGTFRNGVRVYGFTFEAKAGAHVTVGLTATAGTGSVDRQSGEALDTVAALYGPIHGDDKGPRLLSADDENGYSAVLPRFDVSQDGTYLVIFSSWDDPGAGHYRVQVGCEGTSYQCQRPVNDAPCVAGTRYIQGQTVIGTETWDRCNVVLLENTVVQQGAVLTINPGVHVQGNIIGTPPYGTVSLQVDGTLQAVGTAEHPVVFDAVRDGWKGIVLNGSSNTLENVYIEKASRGVEASGSHNTLRNVIVDHGDTGFFFNQNSTDNHLVRVRADQVANGLVLGNGAAANVEDSVFLGTPGSNGSGVRAAGSAASQVSRSLVSGFGTGMDLNNTQLEVTDSTIAKNGVGVRVDGPNGGLHPAYTCPSFPTQSPPSRPAPSFPQSWGYDPVFVRTDIVDSAGIGLRIVAPQLVVVEDSNIRRNHGGVSIEADSLADSSHISGSNVTDNGDTFQVDSWHSNGVLDISGNFWNRISDPELSASWRVTHQQGQTCSLTPTGFSGCSWNGSAYICGSYTCTSSNVWTCTAPTTAQWTGRVAFTGFSPRELDAGPHLDDLVAMVNAERVKLGLPAGATEEAHANFVGISEIDYDQPGTDSGEFIELYNPGSTALNLTDFRLELIDGATGQPYGSYELSAAGSTLNPGQFLVVGKSAVINALPAGVLKIRLTKALQNGSPDGVRVVTHDGHVVDGLAYEGTIGGTGEGQSPRDRETNSGPNKSLSRCGADTDDNAHDFRAATPTPGAANACQ
jgi:hypothetical protein